MTTVGIGIDGQAQLALWIRVLACSGFREGAGATAFRVGSPPKPTGDADHPEKR
jgi:hypothetical protein